MLRSRIAYAVFLVSALAVNLFSASFSVGGAALLAAAVAVPVACAVMLRLCGSGLEFSIDAPKNVSKGQPARATVRVRARNMLLPGIVRAELGCGNMLTGERAVTPVSFAVSSRRGDSVDLEIGSGQCGVLTFDVGGMRVYDLLGLTYLRGRAAARGACLVLPDVVTSEIVIGQPGAGEGGFEYSANKPGYDLSEPLSIREYVAGDSLKSIHWKLTSKFDKFMVREPGLPAEKSVLLLLETGVPSPGPLPEPRVRATVAEAFLSLSQGLLAAGVQHTVGWQDRNEEAFVRLSLDSEDDVPGVLPKVLAAGYGFDEIGCLRRYARTIDGVDQAHVVIVSAGGVYDDEDCAPRSTVTRLVSPSLEDIRAVTI
jgi:uncharacterized protein (DUF58 family)